MAVGTPRIVLARRRTGCFLAQCTPPSPAGNRALLHASARRTPAPSSPISAHGPSDVRSCKDARTRSCAGGPRAADAHRGTSSREPVSQTRLLALSLSLSLPAPLARYCTAGPIVSPCRVCIRHQPQRTRATGSSTLWLYFLRLSRMILPMTRSRSTHAHTRFRSPPRVSPHALRARAAGFSSRTHQRS